jgi:hypothetical protein
VNLLRRVETADVSDDAALQGAGAPWAPPVVEALARLRTEQERTALLSGQITDEQLRIDTDEATAGQETYEDPSRAVAIAEGLRRRRDGLSLTARGLRVAEERIGELTVAVWRAQRDDLAARLKAAAAELTRRRVKTARLLEQLAEHEGAVYVPTSTILPDGFNSAVSMTRTQVAADDCRLLALMMCLLDLAVAGAPLPTFLSMGEQLTAASIPASMFGDAALRTVPRVQFDPLMVSRIDTALAVAG